MKILFGVFDDMPIDSVYHGSFVVVSDDGSKDMRIVIYCTHDFFDISSWVGIESAERPRNLQGFEEVMKEWGMLSIADIPEKKLLEYERLVVLFWNDDAPGKSLAQRVSEWVEKPGAIDRSFDYKIGWAFLNETNILPLDLRLKFEHGQVREQTIKRMPG